MTNELLTKRIYDGFLNVFWKKFEDLVKHNFLIQKSFALQKDMTRTSSPITRVICIDKDMLSQGDGKFPEIFCIFDTFVNDLIDEMENDIILRGRHIISSYTVINNILYGDDKKLYLGFKIWLYYV